MLSVWNLLRCVDLRERQGGLLNTTMQSDQSLRACHTNSMSCLQYIKCLFKRAFELSRTVYDLIGSLDRCNNFRDLDLVFKIKLFRTLNVHY